ncbi:MAG: GHKL domain-containing protein [Ruminococcaceae bacterium]|nr:GHKL domain-containing protein [Oscillospiraceae bacterium]
MNYPIEYLANFIDALAGVWFVFRFNNGSVNNKKSIIGFVLSVLSILTLSNYFTHYTHFSEYHVVIMTLMLYGFAFSIKNKRIVAKILSPLIYMLTLIIVNTLILYVYSLFSPNKFDEIVFASSFHRYIYIFLCKIAMISVLMIINRIFVIRERFSLIDLFLYLVFPAGTVLTLYIFLMFGIEYDISRYSVAVITVICVLFISNFTVLILFKKSMHNASAKHELELINNRRELEEERYRELGNVYSRLRVTRHDIREHLMYINCLMEEHKYDEVNKYISDKQSELEKTKRFYHTGNRMADFILDSKVTQNEDIKFEISGALDNLEGIDDLDLTSLLGNMLNNAIEGVQDSAEKRIEIVFRMQGEYQNITCKNTINGSVLSKNPDLKSSKKDTLNHGFGIKSIKNTVEKYNGMIEFYEDNGMFCVHCALPLQAPARNE